jgi:hypothetical protein
MRLEDTSAIEAGPCHESPRKWKLSGYTNGVGAPREIRKQHRIIWDRNALPRRCVLAACTHPPMIRSASTPSRSIRGLRSIIVRSCCTTNINGCCQHLLRKPCEQSSQSHVGAFRATRSCPRVHRPGRATLALAGQQKKLHEIMTLVRRMYIMSMIVPRWTFNSCLLRPSANTIIDRKFLRSRTTPRPSAPPRRPFLSRGPA